MDRYSFVVLPFLEKLAKRLETAFSTFVLLHNLFPRQVQDIVPAGCFPKGACRIAARFVFKISSTPLPVLSAVLLLP
jgi:hypothetical protein